MTPEVIESADPVVKTVLDSIPEPPPIPVEDVVSHLNTLGEASFASLGLGGWTPVGIVQQCFEYLHVSLGVPWWEAIMIGKSNKLMK